MKEQLRLTDSSGRRGKGIEENKAPSLPYFPAKRQKERQRFIVHYKKKNYNFFL
jgi:hypothetical protein